MLGFTVSACRADQTVTPYKTQNVIVVVIDGPRYSESWGQAAHAYIPNMSQFMAPEGVVCTNFRNNGPTYTNAGHTAILTGVYQDINNGGGEKPKNHNFLQAYVQQYGVDSRQCRIIASKDKIEILADCKQSGWEGKYLPSTDCGLNGLYSGYRHDTITHDRVMTYLQEEHPKMLFINFREPDFSAHQTDWDNYIQGIIDTDQYVYEIFQFIKTDPFYKDKTTMIVSNDHGRHLDEVSPGFVSHGDGCEGCRHINLFAFGPDFQKNILSSAVREQIDIPATISELLGLRMNNAKGNVMWELFAE
jgi:hypothetical protein